MEMQNKPRLYVIFTVTGQEKVIQTLLEKTVLQKYGMPEEFLFSPVREEHMRIGQKDIYLKKNLYPGYLFLNSSHSESFYRHVYDTHFFSFFGKSLRILKKDPTGISDYSEYEEDANLDHERFLGALPRDEEKMILRLCSLKRDSDGMIREQNKNVPVDMSNHQGEPGQGNRLFEMSTSHGIKVVKKGSTSANRQPGEVRTIVIDGPLKGLEGQIISTNPHKQTAVLHTTMMHREIDIQVPLAIVGTIEE